MIVSNACKCACVDRRPEAMRAEPALRERRDGLRIEGHVRRIAIVAEDPRGAPGERIGFARPIEKVQPGVARQLRHERARIAHECHSAKKRREFVGGIPGGAIMGAGTPTIEFHEGRTDRG